MAGLSTCIRKAGKALNKSDADAIKEIQQEYVNDGMTSSKAAEKALSDYTEILAQERNEVLDQLESQGADVRAERGEVTYSAGTTTGKPDTSQSVEQDVPPMRYRIEDETIEDLIDEHPTHPVAQLHKIGITVEDQANYNPGITEKLLNRARDMSEGQIENLLGLIPRRNLSDFAGDKIPAVNDYVREAARMDGTRNELLQGFEKVLNPWNKFVSKNKRWGRLLGTLMHESTLAEVDPSKEFESFSLKTIADKQLDAVRKQKYAILKKRFDAMPQEAQDLFNTVRDAYAKQRTDVHAALQENIEATDADPDVKQSLLAELRTKFEAGRVRGPYFPLTRFGDHWAVAKDSSGEIVAFSRFEKPSEMRAWEKAFKDMNKGFDVTTGKKMDEKSMLNRIDPKFVSRVAELTQSVKGPMGQQLTDEVWQLYLRSMPEMSMRKAFIHRKGRLGFSADAMRAFGHHMFHGAHQLSKLKHIPRMEQHIDNIREQATKSEEEGGNDAKWAAPIYKEMVRRHDFAKNPSSSPIATMATSLGFAWYLGASPAAAMVNMSQTPIVAFPHLGAKYNNFGKAAKELGKAMLDYFGSRGTMANRLRGDERKAFDEAYTIGLFERTQAHDLAGVSEEGMEYNTKMRAAMETISWMFHKAEEANRQITYMAAYRMARDSGKSHDDAVHSAEDDTWDSHFDYTNANRPRVMQGNSARVILLFKQYSINMTYRLTRDFAEATKGTKSQLQGKGLTDGARMARQRLAGILTMTAVLGGLSAMPLKWAVTGIIDSLFSDEDEQFNSEAAFRAYLHDAFGEEHGPKAQEFIMKGGVDAGVGATLSSRISLNNLLWRSPEAHLEGDELFAHYLGEFMGPVPSIPKDYFMAYKNFKEDHSERGLERLMPVAARNVLKAWRYHSEGALNFRQQPILDADAFTNKDVFLQAIGFTPAKLTQQYEQNRAVKGAEQFIKRRRQLVMDRLFLAIRTNDASGYKESLEDIKKFNKANPAVAVNASGLIQSAKARNRFDARSLGGIAIDPKLSHLHKEYQFAPRRDKETK